MRWWRNVQAGSAHGRKPQHPRQCCDLPRTRALDPLPRSHPRGAFVAHVVRDQPFRVTHAYGLHPQVTGNDVRLEHPAIHACQESGSSHSCDLLPDCFAYRCQILGRWTNPARRLRSLTGVLPVESFQVRGPWLSSAHGCGVIPLSSAGASQGRRARKVAIFGREFEFFSRGWALSAPDTSRKFRDTPPCFSERDHPTLGRR